MTKSPQIPEWAFWCLESWPNVRERFERRWDVLERSVWPALQKKGFPQPTVQSLSICEGKDPYYVCLDSGAWCAEFVTASNIEAVKDDRLNLGKLNMRIVTLFAELASLLHERSDILEKGTLSEVVEDDPSWMHFNLWSVLRSAIERYPNWKGVAEGNYGLLSAIDCALGQSRQGPELIDLVEILADEPVSDVVPHRLFTTFDASGQMKGAPLRTLDRRLAERRVAEPTGQRSNSARMNNVRDCLTDTALAALASVVYDVEEDQFSKDKIAMQRNRDKKRRSHPDSQG